MPQPAFNYDLPFDEIDFRARPDLYRIGRGEQGVLLVEPYKSELLPHWRFRTPEIASESAAALTELFHAYKEQADFVGMDMARKFLQMGWTRSMRYANHRSGKKYVGPVPAERKGQSGAWGREVAPRERDEEKLKSALIFKERYEAVKSDPDYAAARRAHRERYESADGGRVKRTRGRV